MSIVLNHMIVPAADKVTAAEFLATLLDLPVGEPTGPFVPVRVNDELTLDFGTRAAPAPGHYAFLVDDTTFDKLLAYVRSSPGIDYGSGVESGWDRQINHLGGGRGVYVRDPNGHGYEFFTAVA